MDDLTTRKQDDYEEDYDDGTDLLSGLGSFSTPPAQGAETSSLGRMYSTGTNVVEGPKSVGNQVPLSALGNRFVDGPDTVSQSTQESSSQFTSSSLSTVQPMKKARIDASDPTKGASCPKPTICSNIQPATSSQSHISHSSSITVAKPEQQRPSFEPSATLPPSTIWAIRTGFFDTPDDASWVYINTQTLNLPGPTDPNHVAHTYLSQIKDRVKRALKPTRAIGVSVPNGRDGSAVAGLGAAGSEGDDDGVGPVDETDAIPEADYMLELEKELERVQNKIQNVCANNWASRYKQPKVVSSRTELVEKELASKGKEEGISSGDVGKSQEERAGNHAATKGGSEWGAGRYIFKHKTKGLSKGKGQKLA